MTDFIETPVYSFATAPPAVPRLYFCERKLASMAIWGALACPYTPPQYTVFPGNGQVGRWTMHLDGAVPPLVVAENPLTDASEWKLLLAQLLPGMRLCYEDFETSQRWIWILTDEIIERDHDNNLRLGCWPD